MSRTIHAGNLRRRSEARVIAGVAGGVADAIGVDALYVRVAFGVLTLAGGAGFVLYAAGWLLLPGSDGPASLHIPRGRGGAIDAAALGAVVLGSLLLLRSLGLWFPDTLVWPIVLAAVGYALVWGKSSDRPASLRPSTDRPGSREAAVAGSTDGTPFDRLGPVAATAFRSLTGSGRRALGRVIAGIVLVIGGVGVFVATNASLAALRQGLLAGFVLMAGLAMILAPWLLRLSNDLLAERRQRIRSEERAEMAAHLHDSVLQTLALIQRRPDQSTEVITLVRRQERELRAWLFGDPGRRADGTSPAGAARAAGAAGGAVGAVGAVGATSLVGAIDDAAADVENDHGIRVEWVRVGDAPLDDRMRALVGAAREAMVNAAKHAGVDVVDVYVEAGPTEVSVFVRDRGRGFDPSAIATDRHGVVESIRARMERHGGRAEVRSHPEEGTEVELVMPR